MSIIFSAVVAIAAFVGGLYVESKFSSKVAADEAAVKADVSAIDAKVKTDAAAAVADVKKI